MTVPLYLSKISLRSSFEDSSVSYIEENNTTGDLSLHSGSNKIKLNGDVEYEDGDGVFTNLKTKMDSFSYEAGSDIDITNNVISCTTDVSSKQDVLNSGTNAVLGSLVVGPIITSVIPGEIHTSGDMYTNKLNSTGLSVAPDVNVDTVLGKCKIGSYGTDDGAGFGNVQLSDYAFFQNNVGQTIINSYRGKPIAFKNNNAAKMTIKSNGHVGIGTENPQAPLHIAGASTNTITQDPSFGGQFLTWNGVSRTTFSSLSPFNGVSAFVNGNIVANSMWVGYGISYSSDSRVKKNIVDLDDEEALHSIRKLRPQKYKYKDYARGDSEVIGFIAQEVSEDLPEAHEIGTNYLPNIQTEATLQDNQLIFTNDLPELEYDGSGTLFKKLKLIDASLKEHFVEIVEGIHSKTITIVLPEEGDEMLLDGNNMIFVYGQEVNNFHKIKKDYIFTVATAAIQELDRQLQAEKQKTATILLRLEALENK